jgi:hypothetical protein
VGERSRGCFATPADSPPHDCSPYSHVHLRRERLGFVHRSRTLFCRPAPNPNATIRNFFTAVRPLTRIPPSRQRKERSGVRRPSGALPRKLWETRWAHPAVLLRLVLPSPWMRASPPPPVRGACMFRWAALPRAAPSPARQARPLLRGVKAAAVAPDTVWSSAAPRHPRCEPPIDPAPPLPPLSHAGRPEG